MINPTIQVLKYDQGIYVYYCNYDKMLSQIAATSSGWSVCH